jgi:spermidine synthase
LPLALLPLLLLLVSQGEAAWWFALPLHLISFGALALLCLGRLVESRPDTTHLTGFYLWLAAGGALGGVFNTLVAPALFRGIAEYPLVIAGACFLLAAGSGVLRPVFEPRQLVKPALVGVLTLAGLVANQRLGGEPRALLFFLAAPAILCFSLSREPARFAYAVAFLLVAGVVGETPAWGRVLHAERTFFGVYRISESTDGRFVTLYHGTTVHGRQVRGSTRPEPLTYYRADSPIADVLHAVDRAPRSVGVVGLGVGSLASYSRPGDTWTFYEIDPAVERMARDTRFFGFLAACDSCAVVVGDARVSLEASRAAHDLLVLDAFSSDAIPIHLLTREALEVYSRRLAPGGVLAVHISNRHVELRPVLARLARDRQWIAAARFDAVPEALQDRFSSSEWLVMARRAEDIAAIQRNPQWTTLAADNAPAWSDDFSNIWTALRWR